MNRKHKTFISILAFIISLTASILGYCLIGIANLPPLWRTVCFFIFTLQFLTTNWLIQLIFNKK